ncbi:hypothetical protein [Pedobacter nutrimenti]|uniref:hypothetical protein n=1 Tax=Pedobacter nutrimenti TaxID=1241337 RepID=UPI00292FA311|nr:hypothetical protein [Pedobacter nutrimenti]
MLNTTITINEQIVKKHIAEIEPTDRIVNLGEVLEIESDDYGFSCVIFRLNQKQVVRFLSDEVLWCYKS